MDDYLIGFLTQYILKSGEQLDAAYLETTKADIADVVIYRRTARTLRKVGMITLKLDGHLLQAEDAPDPVLMKWKPGKRAILEDEVQAFEWIDAGWIMKELRFRQDGKTVESIRYRMGYRLFQFLQQHADAEQQEERQQLERFQLQALNLLDTPEFIDYRAQVHLLVERISASSFWTFEELEQSVWFPRTWSITKRISFLHLSLALIQLAGQKEMFDWKEIGAGYYGMIGGSKAFDNHKDEFIALLEEWSEVPALSLGLVSLGKITPLYFAGNLTGEWSSYRAGPVHALTDLSIARDQYSTEATTLWLVENRAVLTRISAEHHFVQDTASLIACVDGHLRSSHKKFIQQVLKSGSIKQVLLWSDYDEDGLLIAGELADAVMDFPVTVKWICHNHSMITSWQEYQEYMKALLLTTRLEQEQILGGAGEWRRWIHL
ncbi:Toprim sub domain-containing protein [Paenibacillus sp. PK3_47]|uniref:DUF2399 domain-containing protein n=1 Tax=Paenibacillus sp. PK3_47 TaxID=2072642 RepID=UPI00201DBD6B|nr:DUF2399 domain-containing protein [Paenibacillus sp. PK3_47]UQZ34851.1 Toprim sub domain-containing protein [Paenibacillus sp. PK3_47]